MQNSFNTLVIISLILVILGAINWLLIGIFAFDLVQWISFGVTWIPNVIYILVGIAGIVTLIWLITKRGLCCCDCD